MADEKKESGTKPAEEGGSSVEPKEGYAPNHWDKDWHAPPSNNDIDKIIEIPPIEDMAGVLARAHFKNDRQRISAVRLAHRNRINKDIKHQQMLRDYCGSTLSNGALGKILQVMAGTKLLAADMIRAALGMPKTKNPEKIYSGGDFREPSGREKEVDNQHG